MIIGRCKIELDNSFYKNGQHAVKVTTECQQVKFDKFCDMIAWVRSANSVKVVTRFS
jgi:hypothetical protein